MARHGTKRTAKIPAADAALPTDGPELTPVGAEFARLKLELLKRPGYQAGVYCIPTGSKMRLSLTAAGYRDPLSCASDCHPSCPVTCRTKATRGGRRDAHEPPFGAREAQIQNSNKGVRHRTQKTQLSQSGQQKTEEFAPPPQTPVRWRLVCKFRHISLV